MSINIQDLTIKSAREGLKNKDFSAVELVDVYLKIIKEKDSDIHAYLEVFDDVREQAKTADKLISSGEARVLTGIPLAIKDNILIKGRVASAASKILENYTATYNATVTTKLIEEGAVFLGRTNMDEFAMGSSTENSAFGVTRNPHDLKRVPGGSSGGSAASVAAGLALGALGSDTAGSIRQPAAYCGVVGLKPTYGRVSRHGLIALGSSLDVIGPITKTVEDAEILFSVIKGKDDYDSTSRHDVKIKAPIPKTIGVPRKFLEKSGLRSDIVENFEDSLESLEQAGYKIVEIELPNISYAVPAYYVILPAEASSNLARFDGVKYGLHIDAEDLIGDYFKTRGAGFGSEPRRRIILGTYVLSHGYYDAYYNKALSVRRMVANDFIEAFKDADAIATPTTADIAFKLGEKTNDPVAMYLEDVFTVPANHAGVPAISVPSGKIENMPVGLQLMAPRMREDVLFKIGKKFEETQ